MNTTGTLYVVASPIGNLADLTERAASTLRAVGLVAAEDTRRSRKLLQYVGASVGCVSYHAHSPPSRTDEVIDRLQAGVDVALLTDAGTPAISDPGGRLVARAREEGLQVVPIPGASAVATALSASGLPADRYTFLGFLPRKGGARRSMIEWIATSPVTVVLFEAPTRLADALQQIAEACEPDRPGVVARELTKIHEEVRTGTLSDLAGYYRDHTPRGEVTLVVAGTPPTESPSDPESLRERARELLASGNTRRDVAATLATETGISRNEAYTLVNSL